MPTSIEINCAVFLLEGSKKVKFFPYSLSSVVPGADPGVQAVSSQVTISHPPGGRRALLSARPAVTFPAAEGSTTCECVLFTYNYRAAHSPPLLSSFSFFLLSLLILSTSVRASCTVWLDNQCDTVSGLTCLLVEIYALLWLARDSSNRKSRASVSYRHTHMNSGVY